MDPQILQMLLQYGQHGGMFGGQQPMGQLPAMGQPQMGAPQLPPMGAPQPADPNAQHHHSLSPLTALSPIGGLLASGGGFGKAGLMAISPAFGLANLFGAFK